MQQDSSASFIFEKYLYDLSKASVITKEHGPGIRLRPLDLRPNVYGNVCNSIGRIDGASRGRSLEHLNSTWSAACRALGAGPGGRLRPGGGRRGVDFRLATQRAPRVV